MRVAVSRWCVMPRKQERFVRPRQDVVINQKAAIFADRRLRRGADSDRAAIEEQVEDIELELGP